MRTTVMSQLCLHTLMQTQLSANQSARSYFINYYTDRPERHGSPHIGQERHASPHIRH